MCLIILYYVFIFMDGSVTLLLSQLLWSRLTVWRSGTKVCTDIYDPQRIHPNDFGDPLTFAIDESGRYQK